MDELVDGEQLHGGDAETGQVVDDRAGGEPGIGATQLGRYLWVALREALCVHLVDHRLVPGATWGLVVAPIEEGVDDDGPRDVRGTVGLTRSFVVPLSQRVGKDGVGPGHGSLDRLGVRIEQQLRRVAAMPLGRSEWPVDAVAVALARPDAREVAVPPRSRPLGEANPCLSPDVIEEAQLDPLGHVGEDGEVGAGSVEVGAKRQRLSGPERPGLGIVRAEPQWRGLGIAECVGGCLRDSEGERLASTAGETGSGGLVADEAPYDTDRLRSRCRGADSTASLHRGAFLDQQGYPPARWRPNRCFRRARAGPGETDDGMSQNARGRHRLLPP